MWCSAGFARGRRTSSSITSSPSSSRTSLHATWTSPTVGDRACTSCANGSRSAGAACRRSIVLERRCHGSPFVSRKRHAGDGHLASAEPPKGVRGTTDGPGRNASDVIARPPTARAAPASAVAKITGSGAASAKNSRVNGIESVSEVEPASAAQSPTTAALLRRPAASSATIRYRPTVDEHGRRDGPRLDERQVEDVQREEVAGHHAETGRRARGHGERRHLAQEAIDPVSARARREREEEGRHADGQRRGESEVPREERIRGRCQAHRDDQHGREDGLRHEQLGDALQVAQDLPAFVRPSPARRRSHRARARRRPRSSPSASPCPVLLPAVPP